MRPPRPPRDWLARALRTAAEAADRLADAVERDPHPPHLSPARPPTGAADPHATAPDDHPAPPRRPGEPPEHWLRLVATHAPGLLHDLPARLPAPVLGHQEVRVGSGPLADANLLATEDGRSGRPGGAVGRAAAHTDGTPLRCDPRPADRRGSGRRDARPGGAPQAGGLPGTPDGRRHSDVGPTHPGPSTAQPTPGLDSGWTAHPGPGSAQPAPRLGNTWTGLDSAWTAHPGSGTALPGPPGVVPGWPGRSQPGAPIGDAPHDSHPNQPGAPGDDHDPASGRVTEAATGRVTGGASAGRGPRDGAGDGVQALRVRSSSFQRQQPHRNPGVPRPDGEPAGRHSSGSHPPGPAVDAGTAQTPREPASVRPRGPGEEWSWRWTGPAGTPPAPTAGAWPALPAEATRSAPPGVPPAGPSWPAGTGLPRAGEHPRDPWPALPDDRELWAPAAPAGDAARRRRLDREQAAG
ncbi:hypothetical protein U2F26_05355 [Micromonospora sp. 4G57]|uniref:hypothetical protein n=1 Tax=Micromonospora sicca TaxID=2202420 RepID=UPI002AC9F888|nr:hypothetical protein [Micromonospora sp. 4G57]MDZ5442161.1 hypothetical protein [Micromonospora sp. 4G57]